MPTSLGVWSLGLFSSIFFLHILKQKKKKKNRANSTCRSRAMGTIRADCSWVARAMTPGAPPQPHGWVRLGLEVSRFPHFWVGGLGMC